MERKSTERRSWKKMITLGMACILMGTLMTAPAAIASESETENEKAAQQPYTVMDMTGRRIDMEKPAERVIALEPSDCEILYAIGAGDMLVGRGEYCNYPEEVLDVQAVQSGMETNIEQIISLDPDVVIMTKMGQTKEQVQQLEDAGIQTVVSDAQDIDGVEEAIVMIGALVGKNQEAADLADEMKATFDEIGSALEKMDQKQEKTVYFEVSPLEYGLWTAGKNTFMDEIAQKIGLKNCFDDVDGWAEISEEEVLARDPDYIVTVSMYFGDEQSPAEEIASRPGWENVTAVKENHILAPEEDIFSRPAPRLADAAQMLYDYVNEDDTAGTDQDASETIEDAA